MSAIFDFEVFPRIEAEVMPENFASIRLLRKLGFEEEGVLHERSFWQGAFHDLVVFALLKRKSRV
jgi:RimJ/RimL family protein N-acetyltransferase